MRIRGCTAAAAALLAGTAAMAQQTTLDVGMASADAGQLDPHVATTTPDKGLLHWMFNGLVRIEPGQASPEFIEPDIAESWEASEDGLIWTFQIREGVDCHGEWGAIDAEDVVFSLERAADPEISAFASDFSAMESVEATGPMEVTITLAEPVPSLLGLLVPYHGGNIVCRDAVEAMGDGVRPRARGHRALHVRGVPAAAVRQARRAPRLLPRRARRSRRSSTATSRPTPRATWRSRPARST